jgi:hypothetical protein
MEMQIPMFVKCALNLQLQQFFFHAVISVVSHFLFEYFHILIFISFPLYSLFLLDLNYKTYCLLLQCVNLVHLHALNVQYAEQI